MTFQDMKLRLTEATATATGTLKVWGACSYMMVSLIVAGYMDTEHRYMLVSM